MLAIVIIALPISGLLFPKNPTWKLLNFMKFLFIAWFWLVFGATRIQINVFWNGSGSDQTKRIRIHNTDYSQCCRSGSGSGRIHIIWPDPDPDPLQTIRIRIRVAPKTNQNHSKKKSKLSVNTWWKKKFFQYFHFLCKKSIFCCISEYILINIVYMNYNIAKHLIGKTKFTELKLPRIQIRIRVRIRIHIKMKWIHNTDYSYPF